jgi:FtsH-binding integral membrane protein
MDENTNIMKNTNIFDLDSKQITRFGKFLFFSQFICLVFWLTNFYLHVPLAMKGSLLSVLFVVLGIIFVMFHLKVIHDIYQEHRDSKIYRLNI